MRSQRICLQCRRPGFSPSVMSNSCDSMNCSMSGLPVPHQLPEFTQTHVHRVSDTIQPSHPLSSPSPPAFNLSSTSRSFQMSQLFTSGVQNIGAPAAASVLPMNIGASLVTQMVKNPPAMQGTWVRSLVWEDPLEKGMAAHSSVLARRIPWTEEPGWLQSVELHRVGHD